MFKCRQINVIFDRFVKCYLRYFTAFACQWQHWDFVKGKRVLLGIFHSSTILKLTAVVMTIYVSFCMYVYACVFVCLSTCIYECIYECIYVCVLMYERLSACMYVYIYVCMYICMNACHINACLYICMYVCMYVCMYICTCLDYKVEQITDIQK